MTTAPLFSYAIGPLHFIGIGGIGMSGIAEILHNLGYTIQGSDLSENGNVRRLRTLGITICVGHAPDNLQTSAGHFPACVVVSSAVQANNPELIAARQRNIPIVRRADMLAELMRLKQGIAVGGTHGKTTTTSMIATLLEQAGLDPTVINGGIVQAYGTNTRLGQGDWVVAEADESDGSFNSLPATIAIITNIDPEHMEHYGSFDAVKRAYLHFAEKIPFYGAAIMCIDHPEVKALHAQIRDRRTLTYGLGDAAMVRAVNLRPRVDGTMFDVTFTALSGSDAETVQDIFLPVLGQHNIQNALAALAVARLLKISGAVMRTAFAGFAGVKRRFTCTGIVSGITIIDDYGHHPVEIKAALAAARQGTDAQGGRVIAVMQPHRYSRLEGLFGDFCACFDGADHVIIADVYAAGETPIADINKLTLADGIAAHGHASVQALTSPEELPAVIHAMARSGDFILFLGAGTITQWANALPAQLEEMNRGWQSHKNQV
ncbi:MAG: UDP-N-acetylmuramate--L-alanine ligase [Pseudomonadota bacterium]